VEGGKEISRPDESWPIHLPWTNPDPPSSSLSRGLETFKGSLLNSIKRAISFNQAPWRSKKKKKRRKKRAASELVVISPRRAPLDLAVPNIGDQKAIFSFVSSNSTDPTSHFKCKPLEKCKKVGTGFINLFLTHWITSLGKN
jgi:hypothetical protein